MRSEKRKLLRTNVLRDVYFSSKERRRKKIIPASIEMDDPETFFALEYLADKKLIYFRHLDDRYYVAKITSAGRQVVEHSLDLAAAAE